MKRLVTALLLVLPMVALAQEGTVTYTETVKMEIELPPEMAHMKDQIPSARSTNKLLLFNEMASLMKDAPEQDEEDGDVDLQSDGIHIKMRMDRPNNETYTNFDEAHVIEKRDFMGRTFLVTGAAEPLAWRLTDERSEFLGRMCQKAVAMRDTVAIEAWFTPEIPVPAGPGSISGLPGLVLFASIDDGQTTYVAQDLTLATHAEGTLVPPTKGRAVSREEFGTIVEEKMKEMGAERGRGGAVRVRVRHN